MKDKSSRGSAKHREANLDVGILDMSNAKSNNRRQVFCMFFMITEVEIYPCCENHLGLDNPLF